MCPPILVPIGAALSGSAAAAAGTAAAASQAMLGFTALSTIATTGLTIRGQQQAAKAQAQAQANATEAERQRYLNEVSSMRMQEQQENIAAAQRIQVASKKAEEARATARVSAGEAGVAGISVDALINDLSREEADYRFSVTQQQEFTNVNRELQLRDAGLSSNLNLLRINRPISQPDYAGAVVRGISTGVGLASGAQDMGFFQPKTQTTPYTYNPSAFNTGMNF